MLKPLHLFLKKDIRKPTSSQDVRFCIDRYLQTLLKTDGCRCESVTNGVVTIVANSALLKQEVLVLQQDIMEHVRSECGVTVKKIRVY